MYKLVFYKNLVLSSVLISGFLLYILQPFLSTFLGMTLWLAILIV